MIDEKKCIEMLAHSSEVAFDHRNDDYEILDVDEETTFHPNGFCGTILLNDEYFFNLCCNHLMFADGYLEPEDEAVYIYGNHKGTFRHFIIKFKGNGDN